VSSYNYSLIEESSMFYLREENLVTHECSEEWVGILLSMNKNNYNSGSINRMLSYLKNNHPEFFI
jgi:hypothetical protein